MEVALTTPQISDWKKKKKRKCQEDRRSNLLIPTPPKNPLTAKPTITFEKGRHSRRPSQITKQRFRMTVPFCNHLFGMNSTLLLET